ncbi:MAG: hypothetical protein WBM83_00310 [Flavobacteriaceae bacterium]
MKSQRVLLLFLILVGCSDSPTAEDLNNLNGYWEIDHVEFPDGNKKEYKVSTNVDFIKVENKKGYRKKAQPKFNGSYEVSDDAQPFIISENESVFVLEYKNELSAWSEVLLEVSKDNFAVRNEEGLVYFYKRFTPIKIEN